MNANLIFKWLTDPRFRPDGVEAGETVFLPVEVSDAAVALAPSPVDDHPVRSPGGRVEIVLANGHRLTVEGRFDGDALARLLKGLVS